MDRNLFAHISSTPETKNHVELIQKFVRSASHLDWIRSLGIGGSFAYNKSDKFSDIDFYPILPEDFTAKNGVELVKEWINETANCLILIQRETKDSFGQVIQAVFEPLIKIDFNLNKLSNLESAPIWRTRRILLDKDGKFSLFIQQEIENWNTDNITYQFQLQEKRLGIVFWIEYVKAYKCIHRNNLWSATFYLNRLREILFLSIRLRTGILPINPNRPFKSFEEKLSDLYLLEELQSTLPSYSKEQIINSLNNICELYQTNTSCIEPEYLSLRDRTLNTYPINQQEHL